MDTSGAVQVASVLFLGPQAETGAKLNMAVSFTAPAGSSAKIKSLTYTLEGVGSVGEDKTVYELGEGQENVILFGFIPEAAGYRDVTVTALVEQDGVEYTVAGSTQLIIRTPSGSEETASAEPAETGTEPAEPAAAQTSGPNWLLIAGIVLAAAGIGIAVFLLVKSGKEKAKEKANE